MTLTIDAIFVGGVLKPLKPLNLPENQPVTVQVVLPDYTQRQPTPEDDSFGGIWPAELGEQVEEMVSAIRTQTNAMVERLTVADMPPSESISLKGLWAQIDPDELEQALTEVREQTNRRLQRLLDEL